jgi:hypothetical protein
MRKKKESGEAIKIMETKQGMRWIIEIKMIEFFAFVNSDRSKFQLDLDFIILG